MRLVSYANRNSNEVKNQIDLPLILNLPDKNLF